MTKPHHAASPESVTGPAAGPKPAAAAAPGASHAVLAGIGLMLLGMLAFSVNDVIGKWLVATYSVGEVMLLRNAAGFIVLLPFLWRGGVTALRRAPLPGVQLLRIVLATLEVVCFYWAVVYLPLADVMTFYLAGPIYVAGIAAFLLKEQLDRPRIAAMLLGFGGVLVALRPSSATLSAPALIAIVGTLCFAVMMITARQLRGTGDAVLVAGPTLGGLVFGLATAPFGWVTPSFGDALLLSLLGVVALAAHLCVNRALRLAPASIVAPYQYTLLLWAVLFGYLVFGDVVQPLTLVGAALIIAAGWWLFLLEQKNPRKA